jgi:hypothetical protein
MRGRPRPAVPVLEPDMHSAEAWIAVYRAKGDQAEQVEVPEGADDTEVRRAWRGAAMRASEVRLKAARRGTLA